MELLKQPHRPQEAQCTLTLDSPQWPIDLVSSDRSWPARGPRGTRDGDLAGDGVQVVEPVLRRGRRGPGGSLKPAGTARIEPMPAVEAQIAELRAELKLGPPRIGYRLGVAPSTVHRVLVRLGINRLSWMDRPSGRVIRRYERDRPGELVHVDIKKLGRIPDGGGWKILGRQAGKRNSKSHKISARGTSWATATSTKPSTTTAGWPTQRSSPTSAKRPPPGSGRGPRLGF